MPSTHYSGLIYLFLEAIPNDGIETVPSYPIIARIRIIILWMVSPYTPLIDIVSQLPVITNWCRISSTHSISIYHYHIPMMGRPYPQTSHLLSLLSQPFESLRKQHLLQDAAPVKTQRATAMLLPEIICVL